MYENKSASARKLFFLAHREQSECTTAPLEFRGLSQSSQWNDKTVSIAIIVVTPSALKMQSSGGGYGALQSSFSRLPLEFNIPLRV